MDANDMPVAREEEQSVNKSLAECQCCVVLPNLSYEEQFAGFCDWDGDRVYVKTVILGTTSSGATEITKLYPHSIPDIKACIDMKILCTQQSTAPYNLYTSNLCINNAGTIFSCCFFKDGIQVHSKHMTNPFVIKVVLYYTKHESHGTI